MVFGAIIRLQTTRREESSLLVATRPRSCSMTGVICRRCMNRIRYIGMETLVLLPDLERIFERIRWQLFA
jgi:hypothetical protein